MLYQSTKKVPRKKSITNAIPRVSVVYGSYIIGTPYQSNIRKRNNYKLCLKLLNKTEASCVNVKIPSLRSNFYGLASGGKLGTPSYYIRCMLDFGRCNRPSLVICVPTYLMFVVVQKNNIQLFNRLVVRV